MRIIPVLDLKGGLTVRGVAGNRAQYRPIQSILAADPSPLAVGRAFAQRLSLKEAYVADLDAIAGAEPDWDVYRQLIEVGLELWVDAGIADVQRACRLAQFESGGLRLARVIAGLESLDGIEVLREVLEAVGPQRLVFSLDLKEGRPLTRGAGWHKSDAWQIVQAALEAGARSVIVLDLAQVGMNRGVGTEALCRRIRNWAPDVELVAGGGIRGVEDLLRLAEAGCDAVLVASALHDGRIAIKDLSHDFATRPGIDTFDGTGSHT